MFEVKGSDVTNLSDAELRSLVLRLATSEMRRQGLPISSVIAGGNQDAADGGIDVRVECPEELARPDFVPRQHTGFQVKKPDMAASAIREEMRPNGNLREAIKYLADHGGAYVIVSAQGSLADKPLQDRREAMRAQLSDLNAPENLHTDFYDRDRLAAWVNEYPGTAAWVRICVNRPLNGWRSIDHEPFSTTKVPFLTDSSVCLVDESCRPTTPLQILDGIQRLRFELRRPGRCIRLVGLSGVGKTRLVEALFEPDVGVDPLDLGMAIYADYSTDTHPSARDMARELINRREPVILVVDNCNPETHSDLAKICVEGGALISLLTIEYDVREDEPEHTDVFRLQAASSNVLEKWLARLFANVSQVDRRTIAEFSHGNFRIARALAETLGRGDTLGQVKSRDLFERIFRQRNSEDRSLLLAAEDLSLAYSVDSGNIDVDGELAKLAAIRRIDAPDLFAALSEMRARDVVQCRGRWRAILPQAIGNRLASNALARIHPEVLDKLISSAGHRLRTSISRRLGNLHDSADAKAAAARWLLPSGAAGNLFDPSGNGLQIITNLAPLAPSDVLARIGSTVDAHPEILSIDSPDRWKWIRLIKVLGYEKDEFARSVMLLSSFVAVEPEKHNNNSARDAFKDMFHLHLSGTQAPPEMRRQVIGALLNSDQPAAQSCGLLAIESSLKTSHFSSTSNFDFGARSRNWGWEPQLNSDIWDWYVQAILLCAEAADRFDCARVILASCVSELWRMQACHDALESALERLLQKRPWIEGWRAFSALLGMHQQDFQFEQRNRLKAIIDRLRPLGLLDRARAAVLNWSAAGWDLDDTESGSIGDDAESSSAWERAPLMARAIGAEMAKDSLVLEEFIAELIVATQQPYSFDFGIGFAEGTPDLSSGWELLLKEWERSDIESRNANLLGGFIKGGADRSPMFAQRALEDALHCKSLLNYLPALQACLGLDEAGIDRLRRAIATKSIEAGAFSTLASGAVRDCPPEELTLFLHELSLLPGGLKVAASILHNYLLYRRFTATTTPKLLVDLGRMLLTQLDFSHPQDMLVNGISEIIEICCSENLSETGKHVANTLREGLKEGTIRFHEVRRVVDALSKAQPNAVLDILVLGTADESSMWRFNIAGGRRRIPFRSMGLPALLAWAAIDSEPRFRVLGALVPLFSSGDFEESNKVDPMFIELLDAAPDKAAFLGGLVDQVRPNMWSGSLKNKLDARKAELMQLAVDNPGEVADWVNLGLPDLDRLIEGSSSYDSDQEESFE